MKPCSTFLALPALSLLAVPAALEGAPAKPSMVFIMVDDMGWADVGCFGSQVIATPNIDRLARQGMRFTQAYAGCTVCAPSRSTLMTGYHTGHTSVRSNSGGVSLVDGDLTLAEILKKAGYATGGFGKWGLGDIGTPGAAEKQGFDTFFGYYHQIHAHSYYPDYLIEDGKHFPLPGNQKDAPARAGGVPTVDPSSGGKRQFSQYLIVERMKSFIRQNRESPFFCYAPWTPPHARYEIPEEDPAWQLYKDKSWPVNARVHAAFITMIDRQVGEVLDLLDELKIADSTLVFFCSDNGGSNRFEGSLNSCGPFKGFKRSMYEGGIRTPLIARWPGHIKPGTDSELPCYFPDMMPTLADVAGASKLVPMEIDGISILPTLLGKPKEQKDRQYLYWEYTAMRWGKQPEMILEKTSAAIRMGRWKGVRATLEAPIELYDLSTDPGEKTNVAASHPEVVAQLKKYFAEAHRDPRPQPEPPHPKGKSYN